jgi:hypothetical protein
MTFHINSQQAGVINNVGRDQHITGGQQGQISVGQARDAVQDLRDGLAATHLEQAPATEAGALVDRLEADLAEPEPDRSRVAGTLERLTRLLTATGSLVAAGAVLVGPLQTLATWLGTLGQPVLGLLPMLA